MIILIVDDELVSRKTLKKLLGSVGECETAENGKDALSIAMSDNPPDLILLDIIMPDMDGFEVCRRLKADPKLKDIPVIFLSANTKIEDITGGFELGAVDYITKPFSKAEVKARVQTHLSLKKVQADLHKKNIVLEDQVKEIQEKTEAAEAANIVKREFLANISHEMRTPLSGIIGMADLSMDTELDDNQRELVSTINKEAKSLHDFVNDILDFSKIEAGKLELEELTFNLRHLIDDLAVGYSYRAEQQGLEFITYLTPDVPAALIGDPGRLRQVIANLAGNAIKFTSSGEIYIAAEVVEDLEDSIRIIFVVKDTGIGIKKAMLEDIFNPFTKADCSIIKEYRGAGLGMTISRQLVEMMGGEIGVESKEGKGSTFWFTLPFKKQKELEGPSHDQKYDLTGMKVVVVNAKRDNRYVLSNYLKSWGCLPLEADTGEKAFAVLRESFASRESCDLVVTDIEMSDMNGFDMALEIRDDITLKDIPIIVLTSLGWRGDGKRCSEIGINGYLTKPIRQEDLFKVIVSVMGCTGEVRGEEPGEVVTRHTIAESDANQIHILIVEDHPTNRKVTRRYLERAGYNVDIEENGLEGFNAFKRKHYHIMLMDMQMPVMDGYEATAQIREFEAELLEVKSKYVKKMPDQATQVPDQAARVPIIAVTIHAAIGDREKCLEAGADDYIIKPVRREDLLEVVAKWTQEPGEASAADSRPVQEQVETPGDTPMNYEYALDQYDGDKDFLMEVLSEFLEKTLGQISEIRRAVSSGDHELVRKEAHSIKGGSSTITANDLFNAAYELQLIGESGSLEGSAEAIEKLEKEFYRLEAYAQSL